MLPIIKLVLITPVPTSTHPKMDPYKFPTCANDRFTGYTTSNKPTVPEVIPDKVVDYTINSIEDR